MPLYNKAPYVRKAVESVVGQTYRDWELVVVDDGSSDGGGDIVASIADPRIRLVRQENAGVGAARNRGVALSEGSLYGCAVTHCAATAKRIVRVECFMVCVLSCWFVNILLIC